MTEYTDRGIIDGWPGGLASAAAARPRPKGKGWGGGND